MTLALMVSDDQIHAYMVERSLAGDHTRVDDCLLALGDFESFFGLAGEDDDRKAEIQSAARARVAVVLLHRSLAA